MANEQKETGDFLLAVESTNTNNEGAASLESTYSESGESGTSSLVTQVEGISLSKVIEASASIQNQIEANFSDAKDEDQSSSTQFYQSTVTTPVNYDMESRVEEDIILEGTNSSTTTPTPILHDTNKSIANSFEGYEGTDEERCEGDDDDKDLDQSYEDNTISDRSSEAVVDDIELILMPETVQDFASTNMSPQLVRVTELKRPLDYDTDVFEDDERRSDQESDFQKFGTDDEEGNSERSVSSSRSKLRRRVLLSSFAGGEDDIEELSGRRDYGQTDKRKSSRKVQTEITALETSSFNSYEFKQRLSTGKSSSTRANIQNEGFLGFTGSKSKLHPASSLTLLPSKTKIRGSGFSGYESMNYQDQYSPRVAKFTSQDTLSSSSHFLKPSTLYRTRNLSRNLNQCESSESTLVLPAAGMSSTSRRYRDRISSSNSSTNFKESFSSVRDQASSSRGRRQQPMTSGPSVSFRSSLPDLSSQPDNKGHRQSSFKSMKHNKSSSGYRLTKKSSSDEDTSSLIDESERILRSSIDLLLTDDLPSPGADLSCRSSGFGGGGRTASFGYYSARRSHSQPILTDEGDFSDIRDVTMGSPFLPRKLSDMRCSRSAKVILPNGQVAVVAVKEMDEMRDTITVHTDTGCVLCLPFRKVVFAWKLKR